MNLAEINHQNVTFHWKTLNLSQFTYNVSFRSHHLHSFHRGKSGRNRSLYWVFFSLISSWTSNWSFEYLQHKHQLLVDVHVLGVAVSRHSVHGAAAIHVNSRGGGLLGRTSCRGDILPRFANSPANICKHCNTTGAHIFFGDVTFADRRVRRPPWCWPPPRWSAWRCCRQSSTSCHHSCWWHTRCLQKYDNDKNIFPTFRSVLTVAPAHAAVVVAHADEVVHRLAVRRVDHVRSHVQILKNILRRGKK